MSIKTMPVLRIDSLLPNRFLNYNYIPCSPALTLKSDNITRIKKLWALTLIIAIILFFAIFATKYIVVNYQ